MFLCVDLQTCRTCCESTLSFNSGLRVALFVSGMSAFKLSIPCFIVLPIVFFTLANWELGRESDKTEDGLPIAVDVVMLIFVLILSFFVSLALFFTTILIGFVGFALSVSTGSLLILGLLTGSLSALLFLLRDIIAMNMFIGGSKGPFLPQVISTFVPPILIPALAYIVSLKYQF